LLSTIARQIWRQAHAPTVEGVSKWLFIGQMAASSLYLVYSILVKNPVSSREMLHCWSPASPDR
jgi:uncharacterized protein with PQ loop repeat